jgi:cellulose synthase/poly-beta-1,6-N-acetylglucosamine synthase-like glycosyltransferase
MSLFLMLTAVLLVGYIGLLWFVRSRLKSYASGRNNPDLSVSVIVPCRNEEKKLPRLLDALSRRADAPDRTEIVLVDDGSTDGTLAIMRAFAANNPAVRILHLDDSPDCISPKKRALEAGIAASTGEIILTTDADAMPGPHWIRSILAEYDESVVMVLGYAPYRTDGPFGGLFHRLLALEYFTMGAVAAGSVAAGFPLTSNGANLSYRKSLFLELGGFGITRNQMSGDDDLFLHKARTEGSAGIRFACSPDAAVFNDPPKDLTTFFWQRIRFSSKHLAYPPAAITLFAAIYALHLALAAFVVLAVFSRTAAFAAIIGLLFKASGELPFLWTVKRKMESRPLLRLYPLAVLPHLAYVVLIPLLARFLKPRWKR